MRRLIPGLLLVLFAAQPVCASYYTYSQWDRFPEASRAAYIAGMVDTYLTPYVQDKPADIAYKKHFRDCLVESKIDSWQLADNVKAFAADKPELHRHGLLPPLVQYLIKFCSKSPKSPKSAGGN